MNAIVGNLLYRGDEEMLKIFSSLNPNFTYLEGALRELYVLICFTSKMGCAMAVPSTVRPKFNQILFFKYLEEVCNFYFSVFTQNLYR